MSHRIIIVIPAYNEEETISDVLLSLRQTVPDCARVVVNDGSKDSTGSIVFAADSRADGKNKLAAGLSDRGD